MSVNSRFKATKIIRQMKAFYRHRIPESSCARKKTVDMDILVTSRNGYRNIMQSIRITSRPPTKRKWNQLSQFWRTSTKVTPIEKTYELRVQEKQQVKDQQYCIFVFEADLTIPSSNYGHQPRRDNSIPSMGVGRFIEKQSNFRRKKLHRTK